MSDVQGVAIIATTTVQTPKPHTAYAIQVSTPTRTWTVQRRYNDFLALHAELKESTGKEPPAPLPAKHMFSFTKSVNDENVIRERRILLEAYLRSLLTTKDNSWRTAYGFGDFLAVPTTSAATQTSSSTASGLPPAPDVKAFTSPTWLTEHNALQSVLRTVRAALLKRDALTLSQVPDLSGARSANVSAKKLLKELKPRVAGLETGLEHISGSLGDGEKRRRQGMVVTLRGEMENLDRMAEAGVRRSDRLGELDAPATRAIGGTASESSAREALLPPSRVFGQRATPTQPSETIITRPLDDQQLLQHQSTQMEGQDQQLTELSRLLNRQKVMGQEIGKEIGEQNELLDSLGGEVDRTGAKMGRAKRQMNRLN